MWSVQELADVQPLATWVWLTATVLVLGDARGNRTEARADLLREIADRSKQVIWLNPEHPLAWGTGDSDMPRYRPYCKLATQCATLDQLERVIEDLLRASA